jgi:hypothetical protein
MNTCGTCKAFQLSEGAPEGHGECRFGPPTAMVVGMAQPSSLGGLGRALPPQPIFGGVWPPVRAHLGCLCWVQAEPVVVPAPEPFTDEWYEAGIEAGAQAFREPRDVRPLPHKSTCMAINAEGADCTCGVAND